jgi:hypothetical protein
MRGLTKQDSFILILATIAFAFLFSACKKESNPITPPDNRPILTSADYGKVVLTLFDYDSVRVSHKTGLDLRSPNIVRIGIGIKDSAGYKQSLSAASAYDPSAQAYIIHFDFSLKMDSSKRESPLTVRYYSTDSSHVDVDTTVLLYKYPYGSAEVFLLYSIIPYINPFQDIAVIDSLFFFHPFGPEGLYEHNISNSQTRLLLGYGAGDHIAAESIFVFCDVDHSHIRRYNRSLNAVDFIFPPFPQPSSLAGLEAYNGFLYVLVSKPSYHLEKYTFDGSLVDSIPYSRTTYHMTIHNGIVYSVENDHLTRFDLQMKAFLSDVRAPWKWEDGIKAYHDVLYFTNYEKRFVGIMPIADLLP